MLNFIRNFFNYLEECTRKKTTIFLSRCFPRKISTFLLKDLDTIRRHEVVVREIYKYKKKGKIKILDSGGRIKSLSNYLGRNQNYDIFVININFFDLNGKKSSNIRPIQANSCYLPFKDKEFDISVSIDTLEHIPDDKKSFFLQEIKRVTKDLILIHGPMGSTAKIYDKMLYKYSIRSHIRNMTKEHIINNPPKVEVIKEIFPSCEIKPTWNANVWLFIMLFKQIPIIGVFAPNLIFEMFLKWFNRVGPFYSNLIIYKAPN